MQVTRKGLAEKKALVTGATAFPEALNDASAPELVRNSFRSFPLRASQRALSTALPVSNKGREED